MTTSLHSSKKSARSVKENNLKSNPESDLKMKLDKSNPESDLKMKLDDFLATVDDNEFKQFSQPIPNSKSTKTRLMCIHDHTPLVIEENMYICPDCGYTQDIVEEHDVIYTNSNNNSEATSTLRIIGSDARKAQRHHIQMTSDYNKRKKTDALNEFEKHFHKYQKKERETGHFAPPWQVFEQASELFNKVQQKYTKRATKRCAVQGACVFYEARRLGIPKEEKLIASIFGVSEAALHDGMKVLDELNREEYIDIPIVSDDDDEKSKITQYCNQLNIDLLHVPFIYDFVELAIKKHIGDESESKSKCIGTIYFLAKIKGLPNVFDNLRKCNISKPTYQRFFREICKNHRKFKDLYDKHDIGISYSRARKKINA